MPEVVLVDRRADIATVTLNRPDKLNALTKPMWQRLGEVMRELSADEAPRCVIVRGAGDKAFAPGNDISEFEHDRRNSAQAREYGKVHLAALAAVRDCRHPTVALIRGICVGGGLEIAAACDLRIAGASSRFGIPISRLGLAAGYEEIATLLAVAGRAVVLELLLEGRVIGADEAWQKGLVTRVVADAQVEEEAYATARRSRRVGTRNSSAGSKIRARSARPSSTRRMRLTTPRIFASVIVRFSQSRSRNSKDDSGIMRARA